MTRLAVWASGPFLASCGLLAWSGVRKLARPADARPGARAAGLPSSVVAVRVFGTIELSVAIAGAAAGRAGALAVAATYAFLTVVAWRLLRRAPATPCGCLGGDDAPASGAHVGVDAACTVLALVAAGAGSPLARLTTLPLAGVPFAVLVVCAARLAALTIVALPALGRAAREGET
jgi:hypothetical protein